MSLGVNSVVKKYLMSDLVSTTCTKESCCYQQYQDTYLFSLSITKTHVLTAIVAFKVAEKKHTRIYS